MAYATGLRFLACVFGLASCTLVLAPITAPLAIMCYRQAKQKEREREKELAATQ